MCRRLELPEKKLARSVREPAPPQAAAPKKTNPPLPPSLQTKKIIHHSNRVRARVVDAHTHTHKKNSSSYLPFDACALRSCKQPPHHPRLLFVRQKNVRALLRRRRRGAAAAGRADVAQQDAVVAEDEARAAAAAAA